MTKQRFLFSVLVLGWSLVGQMSYAQTVYATANGKKYHKKNCAVANEGKKGMSLTEAQKRGLGPCGVCKPDDLPADKPKKKK